MFVQHLISSLNDFFHREDVFASVDEDKKTFWILFWNSYNFFFQFFAADIMLDLVSIAIICVISNFFKFIFHPEDFFCIFY